jgi:hypothetical protein
MKKKQLIYYSNELILMKCSGFIRIQRPHQENKILGLNFNFNNPHVNLFKIFLVYQKISLHALYYLQLMLILRNSLAMQQSKNVLIYFGIMNYQLSKKK